MDEELGKELLSKVKSRGVKEVDDVGMVMRIKFKSRPGGQFTIRKEVHRLLRETFAEKGIEFAHRKVTINIPGPIDPAALEEMEPLFAAVAHGCKAGRHQEALDDVYWERISRKKSYTVYNLGAFGSDLAALSGFFGIAWNRPASCLTDGDKALVLSWAGFGLRALGRLREAAQPMQAGLDARIRQKKWKNAAMAASNLSELYLTLGDVKQAVDYGRRSVDFADQSGDDFRREANRTTLADALHQTGELPKAEKLFQEAEAMQKKRQPQYSYLYSLRDFQFCDLLLRRGKYREVQKRTDLALKWAKQNKAPLLDSALNKLSMGRAYMLQNVKST